MADSFTVTCNYPGGTSGWPLSGNLCDTLHSFPLGTAKEDYHTQEQ